MTLKLTGSNSGSVALQAPADTTGGADRVIVLPDRNQTGLGCILQVKQAVKTATQTLDSTTYEDVTGLSIDITPTSTTSKFLINCSVAVGGSDNAYAGFKLYRDTTAIGIGTEGTGNQSNVSFGQSFDSTIGEYYLDFVPYMYLDSPSTTNQITYKLKGASTWRDASQNSYINRPHTIPNNGHTHYGISTITVQEVAG